MNNVFNSVQTHGTSEDCKKFSKIVTSATKINATQPTTIITMEQPVYIVRETDRLFA